MSDRKVVPIKGKHQTMSSMVAECMADPRSVRGFVVYFEEDGTMHHGHFGVTRADTCMASAFMNMMAIETMQSEDL